MAKKRDRGYRGAVLRASLVSVLVLVAAAPAATAHFARHGKGCGAVVTTPQTDDGASAIRATNMSCRRARRIARRYERGDRSPLRFECVSRSHDGANLAHRDVVCFRNAKRVTFGAY
jgi:hypothetical protein